MYASHNSRSWMHLHRATGLLCVTFPILHPGCSYIPAGGNSAGLLFSLQHIQSAALFTRQCFQIEKDYNGEFSDDLIINHRSCVIGAIFAVASFLEATINEVPLLRKDFIINEYQLLESKAFGAEVILLIAACLKKGEVKTLAASAKNIGLNVNHKYKGFLALLKRTYKENVLKLLLYKNKFCYYRFKFVKYLIH